MVTCQGGLSSGASPGDDVASSVEFFMQRRADPNRRIFGAFNAGLVGAVGINRNATLKGAHKAHIWGMYVRAASRRLGAGAQLMNAAVEFARSLPGVRYVHLCVSEQSGGAQALYERMGFRVWGTEPAAMVIDGVAVPSAWAQSLVPGRWGAQLVKADFDVHDYIVDVRYVHDTLNIALVTGPTSTLPFTHVRWSADTLRFTVPDEYGPTECELLPKSEGRFGGTCLNGAKKTSRITITPPAARH